MSVSFQALSSPTEGSRCLSQHGFLCDLSFIGPVIVVPPVGAILGFLIGKPQWRDVPVTL